MVKFYERSNFPRNASMKINGNKTIMILALISILLCACPGCFLLVPGVGIFIGSMDNIQNFNDLLNAVWSGLTRGGWLICVSGVFILVPFVLASIAVVKNNTLDEIESLEPTGISGKDPIPPTS